MIDKCPHCNTEKLVSPSGRPTSPILIIGEFPGEEELDRGVPMVGAMGKVLRTEMARCKLDVNQMRLTNLWIHAPNKSKACFEYGIQLAIHEAKNKRAILLLGSETARYFCNQAVTSVCGLRVTSPYLSANIIYACLNPAIVFQRGGIGEVRLAINKFSKALQEA
jgi:uracil-DNA glycosylase family 4